MKTIKIPYTQDFQGYVVCPKCGRGISLYENSYIIRNHLRNTKSGKIKCEKSGTSVANWPCFKS